MKNLLNTLGLLLLVGGLFMFTGCSDDEVVIDGGGGSVNVSNGMFLALEGENPSSTAELSAENVEAEGFAVQARDGFTAGFMWLDAGNYNLVTVTDQEVTGTIGGTISSIDDGNSDCGFTSYSVVSTEADGPAFNVATAGLYKVTNDQMTNEMTMHRIDAPSIIGAATEGGWAADTPLIGSATADGGTWTAEGVTLRSGEWKMRLNCRWQINRRIDPNGTLDDPANGYQLFTNFGGEVADLMPGASNFVQTEDAIYTVTATWDPRTGFSLSTERTGDAPVITFNPNDFNMAVIGDATANAWDADRNLFYAGLSEGIHTWLGIVTFSDAGAFKFRANDLWDFSLGGTIDNLEIGGNDNNITSPGAGSFYLTLSTADEGDTWTASAVPASWGIIGAGGPLGNWDDDVDMAAAGFDAGVTSYTYTGSFVGGDWKFRANDDWAHNFGGDVSFLELNSADNINLAAGDYTITLNYNGEVYSATIQ